MVISLKGRLGFVSNRDLLLDSHFWVVEEIFNVVCLHLGVSNWTLLHSVIQQRNSLLFASISALELGNQFFLLLFQLVSDLGHLLSFVVSGLDTVVVK